MKWVVLPYSEPYTEETKCNELTHFPVIKNTIKRIAFKNAYESSIYIFSLNSSIPAESTFNAPTFLMELHFLKFQS